MEEKKTNQVNTESKELSYDELKNAATYWAHQAQFYKQKVEELSAEVQKLSIYNDFKRADYLFKVLELHHHFNETFIDSCAAEIQNFLTVDNTEKSE